MTTFEKKQIPPKFVFASAQSYHNQIWRVIEKRDTNSVSVWSFIKLKTRQKWPIYKSLLRKIYFKAHVHIIHDLLSYLPEWLLFFQNQTVNDWIVAEQIFGLILFGSELKVNSE